MPVYRYSCGDCGHEEDGYRTIAQRRRGPKCCGKTMGIVICPAFVNGDIPPYVSPVSGRVISSRSDRRDDMRRTNSRPYEGFEQESKEAARQRGYADQKFDAALEHGARTAFHQLPPSKRRALEE